jgi:hypothetical protein
MGTGLQLRMAMEADGLNVFFSAQKLVEDAPEARRQE